MTTNEVFYLGSRPEGRPGPRITYRAADGWHDLVDRSPWGPRRGEGPLDWAGSRFQRERLAYTLALQSTGEDTLALLFTQCITDWLSTLPVSCIGFSANDIWEVIKAEMQEIAKELYDA